ncbi:unnamed protein product [Paramecium octaurelia]|uniref:Uncharacterized protein n=1 Tax=Paramecium octaurelia TaxID=43137 RepID=A0A8S1YR29_PAROT|nr:unnamed protein product [Paramecium octaurelia]
MESAQLKVTIKSRVFRVFEKSGNLRKWNILRINNTNRGLTIKLILDIKKNTNHKTDLQKNQIEKHFN